MAHITLTPKQQAFVDAHLGDGRFSSADEVVAHALEIMADAERRRRAFVEMLERVSERARREGTITLDELDARLRDITNAAPAAE